MIVHYTVTEETAFLPDYGEYVTYAIRAEKHTETGWEVCNIIHDVTTDIKKAREMTRLFNEHKLSETHFWEVTTDMLA